MSKQTKTPDDLKLPITYRINDPNRFAFASYHDAGGAYISPETIVEALNTPAAIQKQVDELADLNRNLAALVRRFLGSKFVAECHLKEQAAGYMQRKGLLGSVLRDDIATAALTEANLCEPSK